MDLEALDRIAFLIIIEVINLDTAFVASADFISVILKALERRNLTLVNSLFVSTTEYTAELILNNLTLCDHATSDNTLSKIPNPPSSN